MDNYRSGGGVKSTSNVVGTGHSASADHFFGGNRYSFIYSHQITCDFTLDIKHHKHTFALSIVVCLFHNYKLFSFTQYLPFASSSWIFRGGGGVVLIFTVFGVHTGYLGEFWPAQSYMI